MTQKNKPFSNEEGLQCKVDRAWEEYQRQHPAHSSDEKEELSPKDYSRWDGRTGIEVISIPTKKDTN